MKIVFAGEGEWLVRVLVAQGGTRWLRSYWAQQHKTEAALAEYVPLEPSRRMPKAKVRVMVNGLDETERMPRTAARLAMMRKSK